MWHTQVERLPPHKRRLHLFPSLDQARPGLHLRDVEIRRLQTLRPLGDLQRRELRMKNGQVPVPGHESVMDLS